MPDAESMVEISKRDEIDPVFAQVAELIYGDFVDVREAYDISKLDDGSELHVRSPLMRGKLSSKQDQRRRKLTAGLSAVGGGAGALGLVAAGNEIKRNAKEAGSLARGIKATPKLTRALLPAEVLGLGGEVMATKILHEDTKAKKVKVAKSAAEQGVDDIVKAVREGAITLDTGLELAERLVTNIEKGYLAVKPTVRVANAARKARLVLDPIYRANRRADAAESVLHTQAKSRKVAGATLFAAGAGGGAYAGSKYRGRKIPKAVKLEATVPTDAPVKALKRKAEKQSGVTALQKNEAVYTYDGTISKLDNEKRIAFGWAQLAEIDGEPVIDLQGDYAPIEEIEKSAYAYVRESRIGGDMHSRNGDKPKHVADLVESFIATPEKLVGMGLSPEIAKSLPVGWWVGFKVNDDDQWAMVKDGRRAGFSVHGRGNRVRKALES